MHLKHIVTKSNCEPNIENRIEKEKNHPIPNFSDGHYNTYTIQEPSPSFGPPRHCLIQLLPTPNISVNKNVLSVSLTFVLKIINKVTMNFVPCFILCKGVIFYVM